MKKVGCWGARIEDAHQGRDEDASRGSRGRDSQGLFKGTAGGACEVGAREQQLHLSGISSPLPSPPPPPPSSHSSLCGALATELPERRSWRRRPRVPAENRSRLAARCRLCARLSVTSPPRRGARLPRGPPSRTERGERAGAGSVAPARAPHCNTGDPAI